jgi:hypothetical protein
MWWGIDKAREVKKSHNRKEKLKAGMCPERDL